MVVAVERFDLRIPGARSLKEKRHVVKGLTAVLRQTFEVSVAEVDHQDLWQRATIAVAAVGPDQHHLRRVMQAVGKRVDAWIEVEVIERDLELWWPDDE
ncbi:MAG TPA: DUF503 domain-containing protein [Actinomycetota bacterium]|nr:DUF503 domain-containing protein [Actinomycetota bacterium]